jgi:hypothetical protein
MSTDQHVETTEALADRGEDPAQLEGVGEVALEVRDAQADRHLLERRTGLVGHRHLGPGRAEQIDDRHPDRTAAAGDERDATLEVNRTEL